MYIDTHTHIYLEDFDEDRELMMTRAFSNGVGKILLPNIDSSTISRLKNCVDIDQTVYKGMMGLHPGSVNGNFKEELSIIKKELFEGNYIAVGEIGIDLYWDKTFLQEQKIAFKTQIEWALELDLPIVIHARDSFSVIFKLLNDYKDSALKGVFHCFSGDEDQLREALLFENFMLGIGGVVTFKNGGLDKIIDMAPIERLVLETDAPYLTPAPYRGKRNESTYLYNIAEKVADIYNISIDEVAKITTGNSKQVFGF